MSFLWNIKLDDYIEAVELAKSRGKVTGESLEAEFLEIMAKKNKKPVCMTELSKKELIQEYVSHYKKILNIQTQNNKTEIQIIKPLDKDEK